MTNMAPEAWLVIGAEARRPFADEAEARAYAGDWGIVKPLYLATSSPAKEEPWLTPAEEAEIVADINSGRWPYLHPLEPVTDPLYAAPVSPAPSPVKEEPPRMETESEHIARDMREGRFPKRSEPQVKEEQPKKPRCPRCGSGNPDTYLALANGEVCLHTFHEPALRKLDASRAEVTELVEARNELFDLRIRCGCGPDQEGPDIWLRAGELEAVLKELLPMVGWRNLSDDELRWEAEQGNEAAPKILRARAVLEQSS
jgi:hypothetical protein